MPASDITVEQVRCKMLDAKYRAMQSVEDCMASQHDEAAYNAAVERGSKAAYDYQLWSRVLEKIQ